MKRAIKNIIIIALCIIILSGCSRIHFTTILGNDKVYKIEDEICTLSEAKFFLSMEKSTYENSFGQDIWNQEFGDSDFEEYVKLSVKNEMSQLTCMNLLAKEKGITLSSDQKEKVNQIAGLYYNSLSEEQTKDLGITLDTIKKIVEKYAVSKKVFEELTGDVKTEISDVDAKVIKVQHIFVKTFTVDEDGEEIPYDEANVSAAKEKAEEALEKAGNGEDFYSLAKEYSDDSQIEYSFCKGEMVLEFEKAAFSLADGEISSIIETDRGFYIIKCISSYLEEDTAAKKAELIKNEKVKAFSDVYDPFVKSLTSTFNTNLWDDISIDSIQNVDINLYDVFVENYKL